jgi:hypothetical protein
MRVHNYPPETYNLSCQKHAVIAQFNKTKELK